MNIACAASGLTIGQYDDIVAIPVSLQSYISRNLQGSRFNGSDASAAIGLTKTGHSPSERFVPVCFPIYGHYRDDATLHVDDKSQYGYRMFHELFNVELKDTFRFDELIEYKEKSRLNPDGIPIGWMFFKRNVWNAITQMPLEMFSGENTLERQGEISALFEMIQQGINIRFVMEHGATGAPVPQWLVDSAILEKYKGLRGLIDSLYAKRKSDPSASDEIDEQLFRLQSMTRTADLQCDYNGYIDALTEKRRPYPAMLQMMNSEAKYLHFETTRIAEQAITWPLRVSDEENMPAFKTQLKDDPTAIGFVNGMWDLAALQHYFIVNGRQFAPSNTVGQFRNDQYRIDESITTIDSAWKRLCFEAFEGYYDIDDVLPTLDANISKIESTLTAMKAERERVRAQVDVWRSE